MAGFLEVEGGHLSALEHTGSATRVSGHWASGERKRFDREPKGPRNSIENNHVLLQEDTMTVAPLENSRASIWAC